MMNADSPHVLRSAAWATSLALLVCAAQGCGSPPAFGALRATSCGVPAGVANLFEQSSSLDVQYGGGKPVREFLVEIHRPGKATESRLLGLSVTDDGVGFDQRITAVLQPMEGGRAFFMVHAEGSYGSSVASQMSGLLEDVDPGSPPYALPVRTVTSKRSRGGYSDEEVIPLVAFRYTSSLPGGGLFADGPFGDDELSIVFKLRLSER